MTSMLEGKKQSFTHPLINPVTFSFLTPAELARCKCLNHTANEMAKTVFTDKNLKKSVRDARKLFKAYISSLTNFKNHRIHMAAWGTATVLLGGIMATIARSNESVILKTASLGMTSILFLVAALNLMDTYNCYKGIRSDMPHSRGKFDEIKKKLT